MILLLVENVFLMIFSLSNVHFLNMSSIKKRTSKRAKKKKRGAHKIADGAHASGADNRGIRGERIRAREGGAGPPVGGLIYMLIARQQSLPMSASAQSGAALFYPS